MTQTNHTNQPSQEAPGSQADSTDRHTVDPCPTWPRCYHHHDTCPYDFPCPCPIQMDCRDATDRLSRAALSLKYYQQLGNHLLSVHNL